MSIEQLLERVPPPAQPQEIGSLAQWQAVEHALGVQLPDDYRAFVFHYGSGLFANLYRVYNPFAASQYRSLLASVQRICDIQRQMEQEFGAGKVPFPIYPEPGGLLPWGNDENGNDYFWLTAGAPNSWVVVQNETRGTGFAQHVHSMTGFLAGILDGAIEPLSSEYPDQDSFVFEPAAPPAIKP